MVKLSARMTLSPARYDQQLFLPLCINYIGEIGSFTVNLSNPAHYDFKLLYMISHFHMLYACLYFLTCLHHNVEAFHTPQGMPEQWCNG